MAAGSGAAAGAVGEAERASKGIEVLVRPLFPSLDAATGTEEIWVLLPHSARFRHLRRALAKAFGGAEALEGAELIRREPGGRFRGCKDSSLIGDVRQVLVSRVDFSVRNACSTGTTVTLNDGELSTDEHGRPNGNAEPAALGSHAGPAVEEALAADSRTSSAQAAASTAGALVAGPGPGPPERCTPEEIIQRLLAVQGDRRRRYGTAWQVLGVKPGVSEADATRQYRRLSVLVHPDKCQLEGASEAFQILTKAYRDIVGSQGVQEDELMPVPAGSGLASVEDGLTLRAALDLLRELYEEFSSEAFQGRLAALDFQRDCYGSIAEFKQARQALFASVHAKVLPRFGFEGTQRGLYKMLSQMGPFVTDPDFKRLTAKTNELLGVDLVPQQWAPLAAACRRLVRQELRPRSLVPGEGYGGLALLGPAASVRRSPLALLPLRWQGSSSSSQAAAVPLSPGPMWPPNKAPPFRLHIAGSWASYRPEAMQWESGLFVHVVQIGVGGQESFQLLIGGKWEDAFYPDREDANPIEGFVVCGPDGMGHGLNWQIGKRSVERASPGSRYRIMVTPALHAGVGAVAWEPVAAAAARATTGPSRSQPQAVEAPGSSGRGGAEAGLLPWEEGRPAWEAELDLIGA